MSCKFFMGNVEIRNNESSLKEQIYFWYTTKEKLFKPKKLWFEPMSPLVIFIKKLFFQYDINCPWCYLMILIDLSRKSVQWLQKRIACRHWNSKIVFPHINIIIRAFQYQNPYNIKFLISKVLIYNLANRVFSRGLFSSF